MKQECVRRLTVKLTKAKPALGDGKEALYGAALAHAFIPPKRPGTWHEHLSHIPHPSLEQVAFLPFWPQQLKDVLMNRFQLQQTLLPDDSALFGEQQVYPFKHLEDPPQRRPLRWLPHLVGDRFTTLRQRPAHLPFRQGVDEQRQPHHHQQGHQPLGRLRNKLSAKNSGSFKK